jgi:hypothetical protein
MATMCRASFARTAAGLQYFPAISFRIFLNSSFTNFRKPDTCSCTEPFSRPSVMEVIRDSSASRSAIAARMVTESIPSTPATGSSVPIPDLSFDGASLPSHHRAQRIASRYPAPPGPARRQPQRPKGHLAVASPVDLFPERLSPPAASSYRFRVPPEMGNRIGQSGSFLPCH